MDSILPTCTTVFDKFALVSKEELIKIISVMNKTTCASDPFPTKLLMNHLPAVIDIILHIVNLSISTCTFPSSCKSSIVIPSIVLRSRKLLCQSSLYHTCAFYQVF